MSIIVSGLSYALPDDEIILKDISFTVLEREKASLTGDNGTGKSTLLHLAAGELKPLSGSVVTGGNLWYVPQHYGHYDSLRICDALGVGGKIDALEAILAGSTDEADFSALGDDWDIAEKVAASLDAWGLGGMDHKAQMSRLSGGEKTRVFLAGTDLHRPGVILMDEPTNHLDRGCREILYRFVERTPATLLTVSHDRTLLDLFDTTFELSRSGIRRFGGNYTFFRNQRDMELNALENSIAEGEKAVRTARRTASEMMTRKQKLDARGSKKAIKEGVPRIMMNTMRNNAEKATSGLAEKHTAKIETARTDLHELRTKLPAANALKIKMDGASLHEGKTLVKAEGINFRYGDCDPLWNTPLDILIRSGERIRIDGRNGSGKTTLLKIITGELEPTEGTIELASYRHIRIDQEYSLIDNSLTVVAQVERYNRRNLPDHMVRTELNRYLFPSSAWDKPCGVLSGGEKMRLSLCCILTADDAPDVFILDEPTNNLDIRNMEILASAVRDYRGTVLLISHDRRFAADIGVTKVIDLDNPKNNKFNL